ncbi:MAG: sugar phosphate isomerase/epimerase [Rubrivivax sp.]|nr:sugar phosphate isomerase/epimerase [Rubrivivax sp.]
MPRLAAFGDEIAKDIATQIEVMCSEGIRALELRGAEGFGVLDLAGGVRDEVRARLADSGVEVFSLGSPLGKVPIDSPLADELARTDRAIEQAHFFGAPRIRVFSFFVPERRFAEYRDEVLARMGAMAERAEAAGVVLCHENEARIYGETVASCRDLLEAVNSPALRAVHDTCNFAVAGDLAYPDGYEAVKSRLEYLHIKDWDGHKVVPCGEGIGRMPELFARLKADGWDGYLSLEPHLGGGPDNFRRAARALKRCLDEAGWAYF